MKTLPILSLLMFLSSTALFGGDAALSIEPDPYVSSDHVTICRVVARNGSAYTLDGRSVAFEAQAYENGVLVMREKGRFAGAIAPGDSAETRIGFNGVFTDIRVEATTGRASGTRRKGGASSRPRKSTSKKKA